MKKLTIIFLLLILLTGCTQNKTSKKNDEPNVEIPPMTENLVVINLFHWNSCSHCQEEIEWLKNVANNYNYIKVNYYEVEEYSELVNKVRLELSIDGSSVPLTVIGTDYFLGFGGSSKAKIMNTIEEYSKYEHCDLVDLINNNEDTIACYQKNINE